MRAVHVESSKINFKNYKAVTLDHVPFGLRYEEL